MNLPAGFLAASLALIVALAVRGAGDVRRRSVVAHRLRAGTPTAAVGLPRRLPGPPPALARRFAGTGLAYDEQTLWVGWLLALAAAGPIGWVAGGPGLALVAVVLAAAVPAITLLALAGRADRLVEDALPETLEAVARSLRSGASLRQAVAETGAVTPGRLGSDLTGVASEVAKGRPLVEALEGWGRRRPLPGVRLAISALALGAETGGAHARAIDGVAATVRSRLAVVHEVRALSSQARLSGVVITLAPLGFSALAAATDERTAGFLLRTPLGLACLGAGLALDAGAALWMVRLSRIDS